MEFGLLKSKIETKLTESYNDKSFDSEIKKFKKYILEDKDMSKAYYIYDEVSQQKGFNPTFAEEYLDECHEIFSQIKFNSDKLNIIEKWVKEVVSENHYKDIDTFFSKNTLVIENIIQSKNNIINNLTKSNSKTETINVPLDKMVDVANKTIENYLENIDESELKELNKYLMLTEEETKKRYDVLSEMTIEKLQDIMEESDSETQKRISETIEKIKNDNVDAVSLYKLKTLNQSL